MADMDIIDVNEAFAAQWLAVQKELELPNEKSNMFGEDAPSALVYVSGKLTGPCLVQAVRSPLVNSSFA
jgi:hypothetical protein